jgi:hypothetical protein
VIPAGTTALDRPPWAVAVSGAHLSEQARNTISRHHYNATWRMPLRRLGAVLAPDPDALTVTLGDTGWLANGRMTLPTMS